MVINRAVGTMKTTVKMVLSMSVKNEKWIESTE